MEIQAIFTLNFKRIILNILYYFADAFSDKELREAEETILHHLNYCTQYKFNEIQMCIVVRVSSTTTTKKKKPPTKLFLYVLHRIL